MKSSENGTPAFRIFSSLILLIGAYHKIKSSEESYQIKRDEETLKYMRYKILKYFDGEVNWNLTKPSIPV